MERVSGSSTSQVLSLERSGLHGDLDSSADVRTQGGCRAMLRWEGSAAAAPPPRLKEPEPDDVAPLGGQ
ncbi:hypothetical protein NHX12_012225 [Muraenolepis orangiensis]|uniref:Uncharacterized protein n=1 Tax=Muraenolepis orangiensis TaxID=630683 RepID=A0A9Q0DCE7_9TELE|nr:hypothetical protein NHX12_012225 [Muraenolepis orangiensis]